MQSVYRLPSAMRCRYGQNPISIVLRRRITAAILRSVLALETNEIPLASQTNDTVDDPCAQYAPAHV